MTTSFAPRRALASAAVLATSVAATLSGIAAGTAHASASGDSSSPLTMSF